jgi:hypothetical protein
MLNTLTISSKSTNKYTFMLIPQFARLVEIVHDIAPIYDLKEHNNDIPTTKLDQNYG